MRRESSYEKSFEKLAVQLFTAYGLGHKYVKTITPGRRGWPDRLLLFGPQGHHLYIEWKQPGEEPDPMQQHIHAELRALGAEVHWYDNHYVALVEVEAFVRAKIGTGPWDETNRPKWWDKIISEAGKRKDLDSPKKLRSAEEVRSNRRTSGYRAPARDNYLMAVGDEQVGGLPPSVIRDDPWR